MAEFKVVEIFESINGEGMKAGALAVFVRLAGCNLNCSYCDTMWANCSDTEYTIMTETEIYDKVKSYNVQNITLTGGEPFYRENVDVLLKEFTKNDDLNVEIETNGSMDISPYKNISHKISFTLDYKCLGSGMNSKMYMDNFLNLSKNDTVKFVVSDKKDLDDAVKVIKEYNLTDSCNVLFSPVFGKIEPVEIVEYMMANNLNKVKLQLQLHKIIWDPEKRGV
jgi:7-carboxy-7-deazaguanine synthase